MKQAVRSALRATESKHERIVAKHAVERQLTQTMKDFRHLVKAWLEYRPLCQAEEADADRIWARETKEAVR